MQPTHIKHRSSNSHDGLVASATSSKARAFDKCGQATKGVWGMSWHQEAMKGVEVCEKLGGVDKQVMIPRYPN